MAGADYPEIPDHPEIPEAAHQWEAGGKAPRVSARPRRINKATPDHLEIPEIPEIPEAAHQWEPAASGRCGQALRRLCGYAGEGRFRAKKAKRRRAALWYTSAVRFECALVKGCVELWQRKRLRRCRCRISFRRC